MSHSENRSSSQYCCRLGRPWSLTLSGRRYSTPEVASARVNQYRCPLARARHSARLNRSDLRGVLGRPGPLCKASWALHSARFPKNHKKKLEKKDPMRNLKKSHRKIWLKEKSRSRDRAETRRGYSSFLRPSVDHTSMLDMISATFATAV
jgi:hypothetical protein